MTGDGASEGGFGESSFTEPRCNLRDFCGDAVAEPELGEDDPDAVPFVGDSDEIDLRLNMLRRVP